MEKNRNIDDKTNDGNLNYVKTNYVEVMQARNDYLLLSTRIHKTWHYKAPMARSKELSDLL
jgi:hypothetical protein